MTKATIPPTRVEPSGLSEWRDDPLTGRRVRIAEVRAERPSDYSSGVTGSEKFACPFCAGNEAATPHEIDRVSGSEGEWLSRVVPNRYPAIEGDDGVQEVFIESPEHKTRFVDLTPNEATAAVTLWIRRLVHWQQNSPFDYVLLFKNEGIAAGVSRSHTHSQLIALPEAPAIVREEWHRRGKLSVVDPIEVPENRLIAREEAREEGWVLFCPPAPRFAGESWLLPSGEGESLESLIDSPGRTSRLAALLQRLMAAVQRVAQQADYNLVFQIPPTSAGAKFANQWRIEIIPRNSNLAGFELATGLGINAVSPEAAAEQLRAIWNEK